MLDALSAAREWGTRPTVMLLGAPSAGDWSEADRWLAQAATLHDADKCPGGCGHYLDETSELDGWHEVGVTHCDACAARDRWTGENKPEPGELAYVTRIED